MNLKNILVFPCGSEIGLEVHRSLRYSIHFRLVGANSVDDHGRFVYEHYVGNLPASDHPDFIPRLAAIVAENKIDAIYPAMDKVILKLLQHERELGCVIISSPLKTAEICFSKRATYAFLTGKVATPRVFQPSEITAYPVFVKPDKGYGSRGAKEIRNATQLKAHLEEYDDVVVMEVLPGREYTVDCFTNYKGSLLFVGPRERSRIMNGISVNSASMASPSHQFRIVAEKINSLLTLRGAWFFQVKENGKGEIVLLEVACRFGGTSSVHRVQGVNFALLSVFDAFNQEVDVILNDFNVEVDRALDNRYKLDLHFDSVYIDLDDTLIVHGNINLMLISLIYQLIAQRKRVLLLTKHDQDVNETLRKFRIAGLFDEVIHIGKMDQKVDYIRDRNAIFIDDSFAERKAVKEKLNIPVFAPDAIASLINE